MEGMALPKCYMAVILGKHPSSVYCELRRNSTGGVYSGQEAHEASEQRRVDTKPYPKLDHPVLTGEIMRLFPQDLSPEQISGRLGVLYPEKKKKQASPSTIYTVLYRETV
ncbi:MAG: hypothetical protein LBP88_07330 [Treponema sp.]|jgi:IS30 family transposase|nr:hypothetical protein [Treponema sp.]